MSSLFQLLMAKDGLRCLNALRSAVMIMKTLIELYDERPLENVLSAEMFPAIVLIVIATTLLSPVLLRFILADGKKGKVQTRAIPA